MLCQLTRGIILFRNRAISPWKPDLSSLEAALPGLFCAWYLARAGYRPLVLERGEEADKRMETVNRFWKNGVLDPESNVQFGEGGAGTFSDGKLNTL